MDKAETDIVTAELTGSSVLFSGKPNQHGTASFSVTATDPYGATEGIVIELTIESVNDPPFRISDLEVIKNITIINKNLYQ